MELENSNYTPEQLRLVLGYFSITLTSLNFKTLTAGYINDTFLVEINSQPSYILQHINDAIFKDVDGIMQNASKALNILKASDYKQIKLVATADGKSCVAAFNGYWRLMTFIPNSTTFNTSTSPLVAYEAGRIIGKFHSLLQREKPSEYAETIPKFHDLQHRRSEFNNALRTAEPYKLEIASEAITYAHATLQKLAVIAFDKLPLRICHNDTKLNNILFSKETHKALSLIDLDTIMKGYFFYDFGDAVRTIVNTSPEDERDLSKIVFNLELFKSFTKGLLSNSAFLTKEELQSLPLGTVFMPFIHGLRALTDYLNNNKYYKVSYENQNLDRCKGLFYFSEKALENQQEIQQILAHQLKEK